MDILLTGNVGQVSQVVLDRINEDYRCVVFGRHGNKALKGKNLIPFQENEEEDSIYRVYSTYDFDTVIFFSHALDGTVKVFDELENLEHTLYTCKKYRIKNFIYVCSNDLQDQTADHVAKKITSRFVLMDSCEELCRRFSDNQVLHTTILRVPYIYNLNQNGNQLYRWVTQLAEDKKVTMRGFDYQQTDFLWDEDLAELLVRIVDEPRQSWYQCMNVSGENSMTLSEVGEALKACDKEAVVEYQNIRDSVPVCCKDAAARREYGWFPKGVLKDEIPGLYERIKREKREKKYSYERRKRYKKIGERLKVAAELIVVGLVAEALNRLTRGNVMVNFLDFRLVYVVIMGTMNGLNAGVAAALLSSIAYAVDASGETQWQILFYNVIHWLPFATYFLLGAISGYTRDKHDDEVLYQKEEQDILEKKYVFLNNLYQRILENKDSFSSQIIGYRDSFGKLYAIVKKLDETLPDKIYMEAVSVLEEMLDSSSVAVYSVNPQSGFARLNVCSRGINQELSKSVRLDDYPKLLECAQKNELFTNTDCEERYPAYGMPFFRNGNLTGIIVLIRAANSQMNMEYSNKFQILVDLIRDSLVRAAEYDDLDQHYVENTMILSKEKFQEIIKVKEQMEEKQYLDYVLLRIHQDGESLMDLSEKITQVIRQEDVLGLGEDGQLYLLLSQTRKENLAVIDGRLKKKQITYEVVKG